MTNRTFIIEVKMDGYKVNKYGDKLHSLIDDLVGSINAWVEVAEKPMMKFVIT